MSVVSDVVTFDDFTNRLLAELNLPPATVHHESLLVEDLAFDSVLTFELILVVEEWIGVMLPEALLGQLRTMGDVYEVYRTRTSQ